MPTGCPICASPISGAALVCTACGFPTGLAAEATRALAVAEPVPVDSRNAPRETSRPVATIHASPDPQAALCDRVARQIDHDLGTYVDLGGDPLAIASELRQAALTESDGRAVEALSILRKAHGRLASQTEELLAERIRQVEEREARLRASGIALSLAAEVNALRDEATESDRGPVVRRLQALNERLTRLEGDWNGLKSLLAQIESLREAMRAYGPPMLEVEDDVAKVTSLLATPELSLGNLDEASQVASRALMLLHEALPPHLDAELNLHASTLRSYPENHEGSRNARAVHAEAVRHVRRGRLTEANERLAELRKLINELEHERPPAAPVAPAEPLVRPAPAPPARAAAAAGVRPVPSVEVKPSAPPAPPATDTTDQSLARLLAKARSLASRVRSLPADSELSFEAAAEIRRATELLRARKLDEADKTLTRLMQTLAMGSKAEA